MSDFTVTFAGQGPPGPPGVSVTDAQVNDAGRLVVTLSNGSTITSAGQARGAQGITGRGITLANVTNGRLLLTFVKPGFPDEVVDAGSVIGPQGVVGPVGPVPLAPIVAWATATAYGIGPPASHVSQGGSSYQCLVAHTSGTFASDLGAGNWGLVASKGADGTGTGTVTPSGTMAIGDVAVFANAAGTLIASGGPTHTRGQIVGLSYGDGIGY